MPVSELPQAELMAAFKLRPLDLAANEVGRATVRQCWRLVLASWGFLVVTPILGGFTCLMLWQAWHYRALGSLVWSVVGLGSTALMSIFAGRILRDAVQGRVESATGVVSFRYYKTEATGSIGSVEFGTTRELAHALQPGRAYRVFYFPRSRRMVAAEPA